MDKNGQIFDIFDPFAFKKFNKFIHHKSLSVCCKSQRILNDNLLRGSENMWHAYPTEVIAAYGKGDGQGKQPGFTHQCPGH
jgi:hypothetical protein